MKLTPHGEGPGEGVLGHHEDAEDGVDNGQDNDQRVETVSHFFPAKGSKRRYPSSVIFYQVYQKIGNLSSFRVQWTFAQGTLNTIR